MNKRRVSVMRTEKSIFANLTKVKDEIFSIIIFGIKEYQWNVITKKAIYHILTRESGTYTNNSVSVKAKMLRYKENGGHLKIPGCAKMPLLRRKTGGSTTSLKSIMEVSRKGLENNTTMLSIVIIIGSTERIVFLRIFKGQGYDIHRYRLFTP